MYPVVSQLHALAAILDPLHLIHLAHLVGHLLCEVTRSLASLQTLDCGRFLNAEIFVFFSDEPLSATTVPTSNTHILYHTALDDLCL